MKPKGRNFKTMLLDHIEKPVAALIVLGGLVSIVKTDWAVYTKQPEALLSKAQEATTKIQKSIWPAAKRDAHSLKNFDEDVAKINQPISISKYDFAIPIYWPMYRKQELAREPEFVAVRDLVADYGERVFAIPQAPTGIGNGFPGGGSPVGAFSGLSPTNMGSDGASMPLDMMEGSGSSDAHAGMSGALGGPGAPAGPVGLLGPGYKPMSASFIAVRGVFPIADQLRNIQRALNLQSQAQASGFLELLDFHLERQTAIAGSNPWGGPWEPVNIDIALETLSEVAEYSATFISPEVTDPSITIALPALMVGDWEDLGSHPAITKFELTPDQQRQLDTLSRMMIEEFEKKKQNQPKPKYEKKGFAKTNRDLRQLSRDTMSGSFGRTLANNFKGTMKGAAGVDQNKIFEELKSSITAVGNLVLFRYLDFNIEPGRAYRYRVKLTLRNPNAERTIDQVVDATVAQGETRDTPFSEPSNFAIVKPDSHFFVKNVVKDPLREPYRKKTNVAEVTVIQRDKERGTLLKDTIQVERYGQFLRQEKVTDSLNLSGPSIEKEKRELSTTDFVIDISNRLDLDDSVISELGVSKDQRSKLSNWEELVVADDFGRTRIYRPTTNRSILEELEKKVKEERAPFEAMKMAPPVSQEMIDGGSPSEAHGMMLPPARPGTKRPVGPKGSLKPPMSQFSGSIP